MMSNKNLKYNLEEIQEEIRFIAALNGKNYSTKEIESRTNKAKKMFDKFITYIDEENIDQLDHLAWRTSHGGNQKLTAYMFSQAIKKFPNYAKLYISKACSLEKNYSKDKKLADINKAIELEPNNPHFYTVRANFYDNEKEYKKSLADYTKAIELEPRDAQIYFYRNFIHKKLDMLKESEADIKKYEELKNSDYVKDIEKEERKWVKEQKALEKERKLYKAQQSRAKYMEEYTKKKKQSEEEK